MYRNQPTDVVGPLRRSAYGRITPANACRRCVARAKTKDDCVTVRVLQRIKTVGNIISTTCLILSDSDRYAHDIDLNDSARLAHIITVVYFFQTRFYRTT